MKLNIDLTGVSKTLMMPLAGRYIISKRNPTLFYDAKSVELVESLDYDFVSIIKQYSAPYTKYVFCARSMFYEHIINTEITKRGRLVIVDLGAGLDTTYYRLNNKDITWVNVDLENVIALRNQTFAVEANVYNISASIFESVWHNQVKSLGDNILFISAGVLSYFPNLKVKQFIIDLKNAFPRSQLLFDYNTSKINHYVNLAIQKSGFNDALMQLAIDSKSDLQDLLNNTANFERYSYYAALTKNCALSIGERIRLKISELLFVKSGYVLVSFR